MKILAKIPMAQRTYWIMAVGCSDLDCYENQKLKTIDKNPSRAGALE